MHQPSIRVRLTLLEEALIILSGRVRALEELIPPERLVKVGALDGLDTFARGEFDHDSSGYDLDALGFQFEFSAPGYGIVGGMAPLPALSMQLSETRGRVALPETTDVAGSDGLPADPTT